MTAVQSVYSREGPSDIVRRVGTVEIANGASVSDAFNTELAKGVLVQLPATWTAASVALQVSLDGTTFADLYTHIGATPALSIITNGAGTAGYISLPAGARAIKFRSCDTLGASVAQGGVRQLLVSVSD